MLLIKHNSFNDYFLWIIVLVCLVFSSFSFAYENNYRLSAGDKIIISVYGEDDLSMETTLVDSGVINYPFLGEIAIQGMTIKELEQYIHNKLNGDYLVSPNVHVSVEEYRPFYINGQVESPGGYPYQPGLTIQRAISLAGGFTERASKKNVFIVHEYNPKKRIRVKQHTIVNPGDIITVEESFF